MKILALLFAIFMVVPIRAAEPAKPEIAVLAAGCFWCLEGIFEAQPGVLNVVSGYAGGHTENPTYEESNTGRTGHAEAVEITFDPARVTYAQLLDIYWRSFDPTEGRGVAPDFGSQYRPIILTAGDEQRKVAEASKAALQKTLPKPIAVEIKPLTKFWFAEEYHQDFAKKNPNHPYIRNVSNPRKQRAGVVTP